MTRRERKEAKAERLRTWAIGTAVLAAIAILTRKES